VPHSTLLTKNSAAYQLTPPAARTAARRPASPSRTISATSASSPTTTTPSPPPAAPNLAEVLQLVTKLVHRNCLKFKMLFQEEDIRQDVLVKLLTPSPSVGTTYLERFDATQNSLEGFISRLVFNYFCRLYSRARHPVELAEPIDLALLGGKADSFSTAPVERDEACAAAIIAELDYLYPCSSGVLLRRPFSLPPAILRIVAVANPPDPSPDEELLWRSVSNIFRLMLDGFSQEEVATAMAVSKGWVSKQVHKIRCLEEVASWASDLGLTVG
jgi:hypothetical protein